MLSKRYVNDGKSLLRLNAIQRQQKEAVEKRIASGEYLFETVECAVCGGSSFELLAEKDRYGLQLSSVICRDCGLVQTNPRMTQESYDHFYDTDYRSLYTGSATAENSYLFHEKRGRHIFDFLDKRMNFSGMRILEVGCGGGWNLRHFHENGATVKGIDLGSEYLEHGRKLYGLDLTNESLFDIPDTNEFDLIIYSHVLEHILLPREHLEKVKGLLKPDGMLYIEVPGVKNMFGNYRGDFLRYLQNAHVFSFSQTSLQNLMRVSGFCEIHSDERIQSLWRLAEINHAEIENDFSTCFAYLSTLESKKVTRLLMSALSSAEHVARWLKRKIIK